MEKKLRNKSTHPQDSNQPITDISNGLAVAANDADDPLFAIIKAALDSVPSSARAAEAEYLNRMLRIDAEDRAIHRLMLNPTLSDKCIAAMVGVSRTTLYTWPRYLRVKAALKPRRAPRRGTVDQDGVLDAWDD